jgi:hypothetical protein
MDNLMWDDNESQIKAELGSQERVLWTGRPRSGILLRPADALLIPFSLLWGGFAIFWEATVITQRAPFFFKLWGVPFVLVGLYLIVGRFFADARQRAKTYYGITSERIIIISGLFRRSVKSLNIETLSDITLTEKSDGSGTITLGPTHPMLGWLGGASWPGTQQYSPPGLDLIDDACSVYETIRAAQRDAKKNV